ncbi:type II toxin-antitoxin system PemK/MazF family toxin [Turicibacter bilis]|uniref:Type II toxin-antitoxin system PemK/MazF family toxin n=1 Tax=Turicibacter bilis TaxID=2735723 RepID=A0ABY5JKM9_9FIRM|nr:type II toxin-antitoxin system PemK/MazF family toxin [Turicibacter bilis]MBS3201617.1 type II toxin-antitoxin system PemK/MazF family toxin [Turicibacter bilis]UUF07095.1 type II toxin-antitoxin system PemK/MazF family toxin [Turicibacter bilis]
MSYLINDLRNTLKNKYNKNQSTSVSIEALHEIQNVFAHTNIMLSQGNLERTVNYAHIHDLWIQNEYKQLNNNYYNYSRGDIISLVDLGTCNIGTEIRYPHPCVVLYDNNEDWVIVAPITAATKDKSTGKPIIHEFEVFAQKSNTTTKKKNLYLFKKDSVIQVDQITRVSKYRILNKKRFKLRENLLNEIDNIILKKYIPKKDELLEKLKDVISNQKSIIAQKEKEITDLQNTITNQEQLIKQINLELANLKRELKK